jgi:dolichyl-diphosphooligosaccharide---protein glycosyltransferase
MSEFSVKTSKVKKANSVPKPSSIQTFLAEAKADKSEVTVAVEDEEEDLSGISTVLKYGILGLICLLAFSIRLFAVVRYESVIHEFDPYFNFRTTKYLSHEGFLEFLNWFDDRGWYPLGRTIGGTIYPGLMLSAAVVDWIVKAINFNINIRHICVFLAPLFSTFAAVSSFLLTTEVTKRSSAGLLAAAFTAVVPSYISRSVGGSYDNEGVAIFALIFTFYLWVKSVHTGSMKWSCYCALSYYYMVAAWGGYVFIINIIPIYVLVMIVGGRWSSRLYIAYSIFYTLGSLMAMTVPFVGFNVVQQAECAGSHGVFIVVQIYALLSHLFKIINGKTLRRLATTFAMFCIIAVATILVSLQLMGKLQWAGRSLTLLDPTYASKYIPIIASVSEHQPTTWTSFFFDLHLLVPLAPVGLFFLFSNVSDGGIFLILYGTLSWYFAGVMVRLMLTLAPIACILAAIGLSNVITKFAALIKTNELITGKAPIKGSNAEKYSMSPALSLLVITGSAFMLLMFSYHATYVSSMAYSSPSIVIDAGRMQDGTRVQYDDYREAYFWLRQNTHEDAKILSWWDYGYQMSAMANRTVLVDNNTWNNTHIATVGRVLASTEENAYPILESLDVDYVLVIFGGLTGYSSDDINKFLWPVRIGSGVFPNDMPGERDFYSSQGNFDIGKNGNPTLLNCVAYKLCYHKFGQMQTEYGKPGGYDRARQQEVGVSNIELTTMEEAFTSEHWIVRIFKVKPRSNMEPTPAAKTKINKKKPKKVTPPPRRQLNDMDSDSSSSSSKSKSRQQQQASKRVGSDKAGTPESPVPYLEGDEAQYIGCFISEASFGDKVYAGGSSGANYNLALHHAKSENKRFFAIARGQGDGHSFSFNMIDPKGSQTRLGGCERPCLDTEDKFCGCIDEDCTSGIPRGEEHNRRWAVYALIPEGM